MRSSYTYVNACEFIECHARYLTILLIHTEIEKEDKSVQIPTATFYSNSYHYEQEQKNLLSSKQ